MYQQSTIWRTNCAVQSTLCYRGISVQLHKVDYGDFGRTCNSTPNIQSTGCFESNVCPLCFFSNVTNHCEEFSDLLLWVWPIPEASRSPKNPTATPHHHRRPPIRAAITAEKIVHAGPGGWTFFAPCSSESVSSRCTLHLKAMMSVHNN